MHMVSVLFSEMVGPNVFHTWTITCIVFASARGDRDTMQASSDYNILQTAQRIQSIEDSGPVSRICSCSCTSSARVSVLSLNLWRKESKTAETEIINRRGENTYLCRSPWFTPKAFEHVHAFIPSLNSWITAIISEAHRDERSFTTSDSDRQNHRAFGCRWSRGRVVLLPSAHLLQSANNKYQVRGRSERVNTALFYRQ